VNADGAPKREVGRITVSHTERQFPTPERESIRPQEDEVELYLVRLFYLFYCTHFVIM